MEKDIQKTGKIGNVLKPNQNVLIQIAKEPISSKGPRISSEISFAGRYMVLLPFATFWVVLPFCLAFYCELFRFPFLIGFVSVINDIKSLLFEINSEILRSILFSGFL